MSIENMEISLDEEDIKIKNKVEKFYNKYNRYPTSSDCFDVRFVRYSTIQEKYGNLENMYKKLGFKYYNVKYPEFRKSDELILEDVANIIRANNLTSWNQFFVLNIEFSYNTLLPTPTSLPYISITIKTP